MILRPIAEETPLGLQYLKFLVEGENQIIFMEDLLFRRDLPRLRIVTDLTICKANIIMFLLETKFLHQQKVPEDVRMSWSWRGKFFQINYSPLDKIYITDFSDKFNQLFENYEQAKLLEEFDTEQMPTFSLDARNKFTRELSRWRRSVPGRKVYDLRFPEPEHVQEYRFWEMAKERLQNFQWCRHGYYTDCYHYDIHASYPARVYGQSIPVGLGKYCSDEREIPARYWAICRIKFIKLKIRDHDYFGIGTAWQDKEYVFSLDVMRRLPELYKCEFIFIDAYAYKLQRCPYLDKFYDVTLNHPRNFESPYIRTYNKAMANTIIGTFGGKFWRTRTYYTRKRHRLYARAIPERASRYAYLPVYIFCLSKAKLGLIDAIRMSGENIVYANTDDIISRKPLFIELLNSEKITSLGVWVAKEHFEELCIQEMNFYAGNAGGKFVIKLSGRIPPHDLTLPQFMAGFISRVRAYDPDTGLTSWDYCPVPGFDPEQPPESLPYKILE